MNFVRMFPYLTKEFETNSIDFGIEDESDEKYLIKGWSYAEKIQATCNTSRWAIGNSSTLQGYLSDISDIVVKMECRPFNPPNQPAQVGKIYVNNIYLQEINFIKNGEYAFRIPSNMLNYGSNHITFQWKHPRAPKDFRLSKEFRKLSVQFLNLRFMKEERIAETALKNYKISSSSTNKVPKIIVPSGGILEYYINLPDNPILKFGLYPAVRIKKKSKIHIAIYNERGKKFIHDFDSDQIHPQKEFRLKLKQFAKEPVKIVFSNSIANDPNFVVFWVNPSICSPSGENFPSFWKIEKNKFSAKTPEEEKKSPNVFIYMIDTLRADHMSCYGYKRKTTPFIDEFSKDGVLFKNCFANASWTKPAVGSILSGLYPNKHRAERRIDRISSDVVMISEILKSNGYSTIYITSNGNTTKEFNFDQGNDFYKLTLKWDVSSEAINSDFNKLIEDNPGLIKNPIFAYLHTVDPHDPYTPKEPFLKFKKIDQDKENLAFRKNINLKKRQGELIKEDIDFILSLYDCEILQNDYHFGKFIEFLKAKDLYENSFIVLVSDHGEQFNEHGNFYHGYSVYNEEIHVPLIIKLPDGKFSGDQSDIFVNQVDILPTILDYLGIDNSLEFDGVSILHLLEKVDFKRTIFIRETLDNRNFIGLITNTDKTKYIAKYKDDDFTEVVNYEMYNINRDFHEFDNLFVGKSPFHVKSMKFRIDYLLEKMERAALKREEKVDYKKLAPETIRALEALGYIIK